MNPPNEPPPSDHPGELLAEGPETTSTVMLMEQLVNSLLFKNQDERLKNTLTCGYGSLDRMV